MVQRWDRIPIEILEVFCAAFSLVLPVFSATKKNLK
jgi:hypothetical protein